MNSPSANNCDAPDLPASRLSPQFERDLIALIPHLRALARAMCGRRAIAEDVTQEALAKAWRAQDRFAPGTNLKAWLFTILRHEYYSHVRRAWRETHWDEDARERIAAPPAEQEWTMALSDAARAIGGLQEGQRDALILVAVGGFSHEDAGKICAAPAGTMKSRVARARAALTNTLDGHMSIPPRTLARTTNATEHILAQLTALASREATSARHAPPVSWKGMKDGHR